jgi:hypothetical protein
MDFTGCYKGAKRFSRPYREPWCRCARDRLTGSVAPPTCRSSTRRGLLPAIARAGQCNLKDSRQTPMTPTTGRGGHALRDDAQQCDPHGGRQLDAAPAVKPRDHEGAVAVGPCDLTLWSSPPSSAIHWRVALMHG